MGYTLVTPPASYPVTLAEAKANCRVDGTDEDTIITDLIASATGHIERRTGRSMVERVYAVTFDAFSDGMILPVGPVLSLDEVTYLDGDGVERTLDDATYILDVSNEPHRIYLAPNASWPTTQVRKNAITMTVTCGYDEVPDELKRAVLMLVGDWHEQRRSTVIGKTAAELPHALNSILCNHMYHGF